MATILTENSIQSELMILDALYPYFDKTLNTNSSSEFSEYNKSILTKLIKIGALSVESLVEECMANYKPKKLKRVTGNQDGFDFADGSDAKKVSFRKTFDRGYENILANIKIKNKKGILRIVAANTFADEVVFFKVPYDFYLKYTYTKTKEMGIRYSENNQNYGIFDRYRVKTFEELCS